MSRCPWINRTARPPRLPGRLHTVQRGPQQASAAHTPQAISEDGFRTSAEATDKDVRLARRYQAEPASLRTTWQKTPEAALTRPG